MAPVLARDRFRRAMDPEWAWRRLGGVWCRGRMYFISRQLLNDAFECSQFRFLAALPSP